MNSRLTSKQYRIFAEGILKRAIDAGIEQKQVFIRDAISYLVPARAHDERCPPTELSDPTELENQDDTEGQFRQVQQLINKRSRCLRPKNFLNFLNWMCLLSIH
jgi:hypothetical protein